MQIDKDIVVSLAYTLMVKDDKSNEKKLVERTGEENPFVFLFGGGGLLEAFENNLRGKKVGDSFDFILTHTEGYGSHSPEYIVNIPIDSFKDEKGSIDFAMLKIGAQIPMMTNQGQRMVGVVANVAPEHVTMDFNHPLAGQDLHFSGSVLSLRPASADELAHGHVHGPGGHHH